MKDLTKEEQELINKFDEYYLEKEEIINNSIGLSRDSFVEFLLSEVRTVVEREREKCIDIAEALRDLLDTPYNVDQATVPKDGVEANPNQVVGTMHVAWVKRVKGEKVLEKFDSLK